MGEREWDGVMCGIRVSTDDCVKIFASWDDEREAEPQFDCLDNDHDYDYDTAFNMFRLSIASLN